MTFVDWIKSLADKPGEVLPPPENVTDMDAFLKKLERNRWIELKYGRWYVTKSARTCLHITNRR